MPVKFKTERYEHEVAPRVTRDLLVVPVQDAEVVQRDQRQEASQGGYLQGYQGDEQRERDDVLRQVELLGALVLQVPAQGPHTGLEVLLVVPQLVAAEHCRDQERVGQADEQGVPGELPNLHVVGSQGHQEPHHEEHRDLPQCVVLVGEPDGVGAGADYAEDPVDQDAPSDVPDEHKTDDCGDPEAGQSGVEDVLRLQLPGDELGGAGLVLHCVHAALKVAVGVQEVGRGLQQAAANHREDEYQDVERPVVCRDHGADHHRDYRSVEGPWAEGVPPSRFDAGRVRHACGYRLEIFIDNRYISREEGRINLSTEAFGGYVLPELR